TRIDRTGSDRSAQLTEALLPFSRRGPPRRIASAMQECANKELLYVKRKNLKRRRDGAGREACRASIGCLSTRDAFFNRRWISRSMPFTRVGMKTLHQQLEDQHSECEVVSVRGSNARSEIGAIEFRRQVFSFGYGAAVDARRRDDLHRITIDDRSQRVS